MNKQRILVLGSDHVVGQRIIAALESSDWAIPLVGDARSPLDLSQANAVVNATLGAGDLIRNTAKALFKAAAQHLPSPRIVHISSMTVYGSVTGEVTESAPLSGDTNDYAAAHVDAEALARTYAKAVVLRPGCEYGPDCIPWSERIGGWLLSRRIGDLGALGDGYCNLVYIDDVVSAALKALQPPDIEGQIFNLGIPNPPTWNEYLVQYANALGAVPVKRITRRRLNIETRLLAAPFKMAEMVAQRLHLPQWLPAAIPPSFPALSSQEIRLDVSRAEKLLQLEWTPLATGLNLAAASLLRKVR